MLSHFQKYTRLAALPMPFVFWSCGFRLHISIFTVWEKREKKGGDGEKGKGTGEMPRIHLQFGTCMLDGWITKGGRHIRCKWRQNLWFFPFENFSTNVHWAKCILQQFITLFHIVAGAAHLQITFWLLPIYCIFMVIR